MIIAIIAGGSGTRLWPLSTPEYPKHLLQVNHDERSLLQQAYDRARALTDVGKIYVVSEAGHIDHVRDQLAELPAEAFIVEPARRGTANCIIAALAYVAARHEPAEPIAFMHADHYIRDTAGFTHSFKIATKVSAAEQRVVLVGVEPDYPADCFGYIEKGQLFDETAYVYNVSSFQEKPAAAVAKRYVDSGNYLWNGGYFVGSVNTFQQTMRTYAPELLAHYEKLAAAAPEDYEKTYLAFQPDAIDYALIEKVQDLLVVPASFDWMDLGSYGDLHKAVGGDEQGNYVQGKVEIEELTNSFVQNQEDKPVAVIGLDDVVVINTPAGILVTRKNLSQKVGDVSKRFQKPA